MSHSVTVRQAQSYCYEYIYAGFVTRINSFAIKCVIASFTLTLIYRAGRAHLIIRTCHVSYRRMADACSLFLLPNSELKLNEDGSILDINKRLTYCYIDGCMISYEIVMFSKQICDTSAPTIIHLYYETQTNLNSD